MTLYLTGAKKKRADPVPEAPTGVGGLGQYVLDSCIGAWSVGPLWLIID